ncbi:alpha-amylase [Compostibacter hankyongensis]|uniref:Alpha-amylase n=1 Tax=Compostibacter hankyongensis TaxID=1007089 RepID=A0ABP8FYJ1_9BACT
MRNKTLFQFFHWYYPPEHRLWEHAAREAAHLARLGITAVWLPPACKGSEGHRSFGYDCYDLYDLGEFDQKGSVATMFGTRGEYLEAIRAFHEQHMSVYADIILNHKGGADEMEEVSVHKVDPENRKKVISDPYKIKARTKFTFPGRQGKYSSFIWDFHCFSGVGRDENTGEYGVYKILNEYGSEWEDLIEEEKGNFDYLMLSDIEFRNPAVREELGKWGVWYLQNTEVDGFRLDAVKHMPASFYRDWLAHLRATSGKELFAVGEYWKSENIDPMLSYIKATEGGMSLFDTPLHHNFSKASHEGARYDLRKIFDHALVKTDPGHSVTFVDNHDTQPLRQFDSHTESWFRPHAYALILLREGGYPCVFFPDLYGAAYHDKMPDGKVHAAELDPCPGLEKLLQARREYAYGLQKDYFDDPHTIGWVREGEPGKNSGCAVLLSNAGEGVKEMETGKHHAGKTFNDITGNRQDKVTADAEGRASFPVNAGSIAVWIPEG